MIEPTAILDHDTYIRETDRDVTGRRRWTASCYADGCPWTHTGWSSVAVEQRAAGHSAARRPRHLDACPECGTRDNAPISTQQPDQQTVVALYTCRACGSGWTTSWWAGG